MNERAGQPSRLGHKESDGSLSRPVLMTGQVLTSTLNGKTEGYSLWAHSLQENERKEKLEPVNFPVLKVSSEGTVYGRTISRMSFIKM